MSSPLPVTFRNSPFPNGRVYTAQEYADALTARLHLDTQDALALFSASSVAPTSNVGPWYNNGVWYSWSSSQSKYVPQPLLDDSVRYTAAKTSNPPDHGIYTLWIELDNTDSHAVSINAWNPNTSQWESVYKDSINSKTDIATVNAAISAQSITDLAFNATARNQMPFRATKLGSAQIYTAGAGDTQIFMETVDYDIGSNYDGAFGWFIAPADGYWHFKASCYISLDSGSPTVIDRQLKLRVNGAPVIRKNIQISDATGGATIDISGTLSLVATNKVDVAINVTTTGASDWQILNDPTETFFEGHKILID